LGTGTPYELEAPRNNGRTRFRHLKGRTTKAPGERKDGKRTQHKGAGKREVTKPDRIRGGTEGDKEHPAGPRG